ncbi:uncharacterized protein [Littorina saxatilis]|uniref:uncharacterized protein n=1 Tax=Littorina saxatilis TaxID=31220 RepID=UPI0038B5683B
MRTEGVIVVMTTLGLVSSRVSESPCNQQIRFLQGNQEVHIAVTNQATSQPPSEDCVIELKTIAGWRIVLTFDYKPHRPQAREEQHCAFASHYLLIGNDFSAIGQESLTSYKFCGETLATEIVSRANYLWVVVSAGVVTSTQLRLSAKSLRQVDCGEGEMQCSPVQCVARSQVCDGRKDCHNGHDEYCYDFANVTTLLDQQDSEEEQQQQHRDVELLPPEGSTCFLCRDGTCISPRVPRYDWRWGVWLWYLCDGVPHCPDGWDEQSYMCYLTKHFPGPSHLFECEAFDPPAAVSRQVRMWSLARCDDRRDCRREEEGEDRCDESLRARNAGLKSKLYLNPVTLSLVIAFTLIVILSAVFVFRRSESRRSRNDTGRQPNNRRGTELQSCLTRKYVMESKDLRTMTDKDFETLRETMV